MSATATPSSPGYGVTSPPAPTGHSGSGVPFVLYALRGRVYASNIKQKLIDLGRLAQQDDGMWTYLLDGDKSTGAGFEGPEAALQHIAATTTFLFLDGQFTALEDLGGVDRPDLQSAPQCDVLLDPLGRGERMIAPRV
ncbi:MAG: hypothetical protein KKB95_14425 [Gammaproteobacteria bacterium]|nr:hypothetical protein [Gammaproteobacteria bacterium]MBU0828852.1 hypothetical protein [Gammaproteobacteria bacterium]MBU0890408.1 hypothetical protein [Gammaproteobacteria bacterium]MBU1353064.1 hypothetical protein [Gammaproteobacteria bacterium]MBU1506098.1 hypothetical protein [Gammaproteobacteria bacterium]